MDLLKQSEAQTGSGVRADKIVIARREGMDVMANVMNDGMMKSRTSEHSTPQWLFDELDAEFNFTVDVASTDENAKCEKHYTKEQDGLKQDWGGEVVWCNPPYGNKITAFVKKAAESKCTTVMLLPARTDTRWFHDYIYGKAEIRFIRGRLKFGESKNSAPFPSMIVIFRRDEAQKLS